MNPMYEVVFNVPNGDDISVLYECDTYKQAYKAATSDAREHMYKYGDYADVYFWKNNKRIALVYTASWFGPIEWHINFN